MTLKLLKLSNLVSKLIFSIFLFTITVSAKDVRPLYFVDAKGGLYLCEEPSEKSKSILLIPDKSEIQFIKEVSNLIEINQKVGSWVEVIFQNKKGFVFDAYIRKYFLLDKKFSPNKKMFYEYYTTEADNYYPCSDSDESGGLEKECFLKVFRANDRKLIRLFNYNVGIIGEERFEKWAWFGTDGWFDEKSFLINYKGGDGGYGFSSIGYLNIFNGLFYPILDEESSYCENTENSSIELITFNRVSYYKIDSENPKLRTGFFTMIKPKADDYDKLLETCKRNPKSSILVKPISIVRKNYTFKINSKKLSLYFKGKDILKSD